MFLLLTVQTFKCSSWVLASISRLVGANLLVIIIYEQ